MASATQSPGMASRILLRLIGVYQRRISPYKGFRCAHSVLHGGTGCSGFAKAAIRDHGLRGAIAPIRQRFRDCRVAMMTLDGQEELKRRQRKDRGGGKFCTWGDAAFCGAEGCCTLTGKAGEAKTGMCGALGSLGALGCCGN